MHGWHLVHGHSVHRVHRAALVHHRADVRFVVLTRARARVAQNFTWQRSQAELLAVSDGSQKNW